MLLDGRIESSSKQGLRVEWNPGTTPGLVESPVAAPRWHDAITTTPVTGLRLSAEPFFDSMEDDFRQHGRRDHGDGAAARRQWGGQRQPLVPYPIHRELQLAVQVNNLFDRTYYTRLGGTNVYNTFGEPRSTTVSLRWQRSSL